MSKPMETTESNNIDSLDGILDPASAQGENIIDIIKRDHLKVSTLYSEYNTTRDLGHRQQIAWILTKKIVQHTEAEEQAVYPLLQMRGTKNTIGDQLHKRSQEEHEEIKELLYDLDQTMVEDPSHSVKLEIAIQAVMRHINEEEGEVLPILDKNYSVEELQRLGTEFKKLKKTAVTRPKPDAPMPSVEAANLMTEPMDKVQDTVRQPTGIRINE